MLKVEPHPSYPPEEGRYIRGNDYSPVAVAIVLNCDADKIPPDLERLVRAGVESGAALAGTVQTENIGFEKIICNITANPNIRYLILGGPESDGHQTGQALKALFQNGVDEKKRILGTEAPHPFLYNLPLSFIDRFRKQLELIDLQFEGDPLVIRKAVWSCYQEEPVSFMEYTVHDVGAYPEPPLGGQITWRVTQPWSEPMDEQEREALERARKLVERLRKRGEANGGS
ncbi:MAG: tetrahydromethanopterin S-methyltransferase subunit A [Anaerolineales bacterium]|nr:tetrahydromethanopterin S-methyltransferase subunit A [Anaerolineales bacterium]